MNFNTSFNYLLENYYMEEDEIIDRRTKISKETYHLKETLVDPIIDVVLKKSINRDKIIDFTGEFIDRNSTKLFTPGPMYMFQFNEKDVSPLYELFNITPQSISDRITEIINSTYDGKGQFRSIQSAPHKILIIAILVDALINNYTDIIECMAILLPVTEYPLLFKKYWEHGVNEEVMKYTLEHLGKKFGITKEKNLLGLFKTTGESILKIHSSRLKTGTDYEYIDVINRTRNSMNSLLKNISRQYYANSEKNATIHTNVDLIDGNLVDHEGLTNKIANDSENIYRKFITEGIDDQIAGMVANAGSINKNNLIGYLNTIFKNKNNRLQTLIESIAYLFLSNTEISGNGINSSEFVNFGLILYRSIGTSRLQNHVIIKSILDDWSKISGLSDDYNREQTIIAYRRGMFNYVIWAMKQYA